MDTPEMIGRTRMVRAETVVQQLVDLRPYPYPYLAVMSAAFNANERISVVLRAAEVLDGLGWDLVNVSAGDRNQAVVAIMRRRREGDNAQLRARDLPR